jgi:transposase
MNVRYRVDLEEGERQQLEALVTGGHRAVRRVKRAQILLSAAAGQTDEAIAATVQVGTSTVYRTKRRFVEESLEAALSEDPRPGGKRKLTGSEEALLIATACSTPPKGRARWTLALLAEAVVALTRHAQVDRGGPLRHARGAGASGAAGLRIPAERHAERVPRRGRAPAVA